MSERYGAGINFPYFERKQVEETQPVVEENQTEESTKERKKK